MGQPEGCLKVRRFCECAPRDEGRRAASHLCVDASGVGTGDSPRTQETRSATTTSRSRYSPAPSPLR